MILSHRNPDTGALDIVDANFSRSYQHDRIRGAAWAVPDGFDAWVVDRWDADGQPDRAHRLGIFPTEAAARVALVAAITAAPTVAVTA